MPEGQVQYGTFATTAYGGSAEAVWRRRPIDPEILSEGRNSLAVEVHQADAWSSDLSFDLELTDWRIRHK